MAPGVPLETVCGFPLAIQVTWSPTLIVSVEPPLGTWNLKFMAWTTKSAALPGTTPMRTVSPNAATSTAGRRQMARAGHSGGAKRITPANTASPRFRIVGIRFTAPAVSRGTGTVASLESLPAGELEIGMRPRIMTFLVIALLAFTAPAALAANPPTAAFGGPLSGAQEVPAAATTATGEATVVISADDSTIWYVVQYSGLSGSLAAAHIHTGAAGANGGVILPLVASASPMVGTLTAANFTASGSITSFSQAVGAIKAGTTYVNLHTAANPGGELRAQVVAKGNAHFATLSGAQEVPAVTTSAGGIGWVVVSSGGATLTYYVAYSGLSGVPAAAHIHLGNVGANGGVLLPLVAGPSPMTGTLTAADLSPTGSVTDMAGAVAAIAAGGTYFNVHTAANPGGEVRGQLAETVVPAPTANPSLPPTSTLTPSGGSSGGVWAAIVLLGLVVAVAALVLPRRRAVVERHGGGGERPDRA